MRREAASFTLLDYRRRRGRQRGKTGGAKREVQKEEERKKGGVEAKGCGRIRGEL